MTHDVDNDVEVAPTPRPWLNRTVCGAGLTSALGDFCYETATVIMPGYLAVLGIPAAVLGTMEGAADALASFTKMVAGFIADKLGHRKSLVLFGYALTPIGQVFIATAGGAAWLIFGRLVSWFGKGLRGPLRDAIVLQAIDPTTRGKAFGFHRAMDTLGAIVGPLLGVFMLGWAREMNWQDGAGPFRFVLWLSVIPGILAVLAFSFLVRDPRHSPNPELKFFKTLRDLPSRFKRYLAAVFVFGLGDFSHSLLILAATQMLTPSHGVVQAAQIAGLLYVGRNVVQATVAFPVGMLADRVGALPVLVVGYVIGALTAGAAAMAFLFGVESIAILGGIFFLAGLYMAVQESLESTVTAGFVHKETLATSLGALGTLNGSAKFFSSTMVGLLWTAASPAIGFFTATGLMAIGCVLLTRLQLVERSASREGRVG